MTSLCQIGQRFLVFSILALSAGWVMCTAAVADDDTLLSNNPALTDLSFNDGNGPPPGGNPGQPDPPPANSGSGGGDNHLVDSGGGGSSGGNDLPPCKPGPTTGILAVFPFISYILSPCR